jgi:hypothetical protein
MTSEDRQRTSPELTASPRRWKEAALHTPVLPLLTQLPRHSQRHHAHGKLWRGFPAQHTANTQVLLGNDRHRVLPALIQMTGLKAELSEGTLLLQMTSGNYISNIGSSILVVCSRPASTSADSILQKSDATRRQAGVAFKRLSAVTLQAWPATFTRQDCPPSQQAFRHHIFDIDSNTKDAATSA